MSERSVKVLLAAGLLLLLLPATLATALVVALSYPAYPPEAASPLNLVFDAALVLTVAGFVAGWRVGIAGLRGGRAALVGVGTPWMVLLGLGAGLGLVGALIVAEHMLGGPARNVVGFALLTPAAVLALIGALLWQMRRRAERATTGN